MSQHNPNIPTAMLVPKKPHQRVQLPAFEGNFPWLTVAIGGSVVWVLVMLVMALYFAVQPRVDRFNEEDNLAARPFKPAAVDLPPVKPKKADNEENLAELPGPRGEFVACARIGTDVKFMKHPVEAFKRAKEEGKLVYMMHLSGNLEDKDFT